MRSIDRGVYAPPLMRDFARVDPHVEEPRRARMLLLVSVGVLLALVGVIWSTYNQGVRERDDPPVIAARGEPYKVAPADPGGVATEHLGIEVFNVIEDAEPMAIGTAGPDAFELAQPDEMLPTIEAIQESDIVEPHRIGSEPIAEPEPTEAGIENAGAPAGDLAAAPPVEAYGSFGPVPRLKPLQRTSAAAAAEAAGPRTLDGGSIDDPGRQYFVRREPVVRTNPETSAAAGASAPSAAATPIPADAPSTAAPVLADAAPAVGEVAEPGPPAPPAAVPGSFVVQLASFRTAEQADVAWREFRTEFRDLIGGYEPNVERAELRDRGVRYRLRVGVFDDRNAAASFCEVVQARGRECLVVGL